MTDVQIQIRTRRTPAIRPRESRSSRYASRRSRSRMTIASTDVDRPDYDRLRRRPFHRLIAAAAGEHHDAAENAEQRTLVPRRRSVRARTERSKAFDSSFPYGSRVEHVKTGAAEVAFRRAADVGNAVDVARAELASPRGAVANEDRSAIRGGARTASSRLHAGPQSRPARPSPPSQRPLRRRALRAESSSLREPRSSRRAPRRHRLPGRGSPTRKRAPTRCDPLRRRSVRRARLRRLSRARKTF